MKDDCIQEGDTMMWHPMSDRDGSLPARVVTVVHVGTGHETRIGVVDERGCEFSVSAGDLVPQKPDVPVMSEVCLG